MQCTMSIVVCIVNVLVDTTKLIRFELVSELCVQVSVVGNVEILFYQTANLSFEFNIFDFSWELLSGQINRCGRL